MTGRASGTESSTAPARAGLVLVSLILVAAVANLNLSVANVALPDMAALMVVVAPRSAKLVTARGARFRYARLALPHRVGARSSCRHGLRDGRSPA
jgi:hypothetical protein